MHKKPVTAIRINEIGEKEVCIDGQWINCQDVGMYRAVELDRTITENAFKNCIDVFELPDEFNAPTLKQMNDLNDILCERPLHLNEDF